MATLVLVSVFWSRDLRSWSRSWSSGLGLGLGLEQLVSTTALFIRLRLQPIQRCTSRPIANSTHSFCYLARNSNATTGGCLATSLERFSYLCSSASRLRRAIDRSPWSLAKLRYGGAMNRSPNFPSFDK